MASLPVSSGVPQKSILGPLLYIIFMNSLSRIPLSPGAKLLLYAADILLYKPINSMEDSNALQSDVDTILEWITSHGLVPNHNKTKLLSVTRSKKPFPTKLNIGGVPSPSVKYLGVTLTAKLTWSEHISLTRKSAKRQVSLIHRMLHQAPPEVSLNTTILPKLEYCSAVWDPHLKQDIASLHSVQKFAGRMVTHNWSTDITELQETLEWKPLKTRRTNIKLKVVYLTISPVSLNLTSPITPHPHPITNITRSFSNPLFPHYPTVTHFS